MAIYDSGAMYTMQANMHQAYHKLGRELPRSIADVLPNGVVVILGDGEPETMLPNI